MAWTPAARATPPTWSARSAVSSSSRSSTCARPDRATAARPRYRLLEPVRQYAAALLAGTPDQSRTRDRHLEWAAALAARAEPGLVSHERRAALRLLRQQLDDVRAAVRWAGEAPLDAGSEARARWALQIAGCLTNFWVSAGAWEDGWQLFEQALHAALRAGLVTPHGAAVEARPPDVLVVSEALWAGGGMALLTGRRDRAAELAGAAQAMFAAHHEQTPAQSPERAEAARRLALAHLTVFEIQISRGELAAARHTLDVGTAAADASGDARARVLMRARGPVLQVVAGDLAGAAAACAEAVPPLRGLGDLTFLAATLQLAADVARERGDVRAAVAYAVESAAVFAEEPDPWFVSRALEQCAAACAAASPRTRRRRGAGSAAAGCAAGARRRPPARRGGGPAPTHRRRAGAPRSGDPRAGPGARGRVARRGGIRRGARRGGAARLGGGDRAGRGGRWRARHGRSGGGGGGGGTPVAPRAGQRGDKRRGRRDRGDRRRTRWADASPVG
jgi:hypothetical protein